MKRLKRRAKLLFLTSAISYMAGAFAYVWHANFWYPFLGGWISGLLLMGGLSIRRQQHLEKA